MRPFSAEYRKMIVISVVIVLALLYVWHWATKPPDTKDAKRAINAEVAAFSVPTGFREISRINEAPMCDSGSWAGPGVVVALDPIDVPSNEILSRLEQAALTKGWTSANEPPPQPGESTTALLKKQNGDMQFYLRVSKPESGPVTVDYWQIRELQPCNRLLDWLI